MACSGLFFELHGFLLSCLFGRHRLRSLLLPQLFLFGRSFRFRILKLFEDFAEFVDVLAVAIRRGAQQVDGLFPTISSGVKHGDECGKRAPYSPH